MEWYIIASTEACTPAINRLKLKKGEQEPKSFIQLRNIREENLDSLN